MQESNPGPSCSEAAAKHHGTLPLILVLNAKFKIGLKLLCNYFATWSMSWEIIKTIFSYSELWHTSVFQHTVTKLLQKILDKTHTMINGKIIDALFEEKPCQITKSCC